MKHMALITREPAIAFSNQLRLARLAALGDAEAFDGIIHAIERLGAYVSKERLEKKRESGSLYKYWIDISQLTSKVWVSADCPHSLIPLERLYDLVREARNDAAHQGAFARHLTGHAIELAIHLEDALSDYMDQTVRDFMVRNPVCAELWQPIGFIRQQMLANSYSFLPARLADGTWQLISDSSVARYLGPKGNSGERNMRLTSTLAEAIKSAPWIAASAEIVDEHASLQDALDRFKTVQVILVRNTYEPNSLAGMLTAFDLL